VTRCSCPSRPPRPSASQVLRDDLAPARGIAWAVLLSLLIVLLLTVVCSQGCSERTATALPRQDTCYTPTNLDDLDDQAELLMVAEADESLEMHRRAKRSFETFFWEGDE